MPESVAVRFFLLLDVDDADLLLLGGFGGLLLDSERVGRRLFSTRGLFSSVLFVWADSLELRRTSTTLAAVLVFLDGATHSRRRVHPESSPSFSNT